METRYSERLTVLRKEFSRSILVAPWAMIGNLHADRQRVSDPRPEPGGQSCRILSPVPVEGKE